uniref:Uncharacterized protein n=1 Tax=Haptolina ericina TaxID=156174 RepID=A0A7S3B6I1_9EUKA
MDLSLALSREARWSDDALLCLRAAPGCTVLRAVTLLGRGGDSVTLDISKALGTSQWPKAGASVGAFGYQTTGGIPNAAGTLKTPPRMHLAAGMGLLLHPTSAASLSTLSLGGHFLGDEGVAGIVNACCSCPLSSLDLASCGASQRSVAALAALLRNSRTLRSLNLSGSFLGEAGVSDLMDGLQRNRYSDLQVLNLSDACVDSAGIQLIANYLGCAGCNQQSGLTSLDLSRNWIGLAGAMAIESALSVNRSLRSLNVKQSQIPKEGFAAIGQATASNAGCRLAAFTCDLFSLTEDATSLDLRNRCLTFEGAFLLAQCLPRHTHLRHLDVSRAYLGGEQGSAVLARMTALSPSLEMVVMDGEPIPLWPLKSRGGEEQLDLSSKRLGFASAQVIAAVLRTNLTLRTLSLRRNALGNLGAFEIASALKANPTLTELDLRENGRIQPLTAKRLRQLVVSLAI